MERLMPITFEFYSVAFRNKVMKKAFQEFFRIFIDGIQRVIEQGIAAGEFRAVDSRRIALAIMASMEGNLLLWVFDRSMADLAQLRLSTDLILRGIERGDRKRASTRTKEAGR